MYTTKAAIQNYLLVDIDASFDAQINEWISAMDTFIDKYTGKTFTQTSSETRYFDGNGERVLYLNNEDDLISVSALLVLNSDGTTTNSLTEGASADYVLYPFNSNPKYEIRLVTSASVGAFYKGNRKVSVTGVWGNDTTVPADIKMASTILVSQILKPGIDGGVIKSSSLGDYSVTFATEENLRGLASKAGVMEILDNYKDYTI